MNVEADGDNGAGGRLRAEGGRLRAGLRIVIMLLVVGVAAQVAPAFGLLFDGPMMNLVGGLAMAAVTYGLFAILTRRMDRRSVRSYGLRFDRRWWADLGAGAAIGASFGAFAILLLFSGGWADLVEVWSPGSAGGTVWGFILAGLVYYAAVTIWEELVFRGHLVSNAAEALATRRPSSRAVVIACLISIPIFAIGHLPQFLASDAPAALAAWWWVAAGAILGFAYAYTGQLALPMGIHLTLNWATNYLYGLPGAEYTAEAGIVLRIALDGPGWLVGVGGVIWLAAIAGCGLVLWGWLRIRGGHTRIDTSIARPATGVDQTAQPMDHGPGPADTPLGETPQMQETTHGGGHR